MSLTDTFDNPQSRVEAILQNAMGAEHEVVPQSRVEELLERLDDYLENIEGKITDQDEEIIAAVNAWLEDNPEATTTVQDGSLTEAKLSGTLKLKTIKDYVTPEMFGAVGDGETDDTSAIQYAIDNYNSVVFSNKTYLCGTLTISHSVTLLGSENTYYGTGSTIKIKDADSDGVVITSQNVHLKNLYICNVDSTQNSTNSGVKAIKLDNTNKSGLMIENVHINGFKYGFNLNSHYLGIIDRSRSALCGVGFIIDGICTSFIIKNCWALSCETGYSISNMQYSQFLSCACDGCTDGYVFNTCKSIALSECGCEVSKNVPIKITNSYMSIRNFFSYQNNTDAEQNSGATISTLYATGSALYLENCYEQQKSGITFTDSVLALTSTVIVSGSYFHNNITSPNSFGHYTKNGQQLSLGYAEKTALPTYTTFTKTATPASFGILDGDGKTPSTHIPICAYSTDGNIGVTPFIGSNRWQFKLAYVTNGAAVTTEATIYVVFKSI